MKRKSAKRKRNTINKKFQLNGKEKINNALIVCNGELSKKLVQKFVKLNKPRKQSLILAADGASDFLYRHKIIPDYIIGDMDSISPAAIKYFTQRKVPLKKIHDQNKNDLEKCIGFALGKGIKKIAIAGLAGKRIDHTLNNFSILKKFLTRADIKCYDDEFEYFFVKKKIEFESRKGDTVSLIALPKASGIYTTGLKYPLKNGTLEIGGMQGALNVAIGKIVSVKFSKGYLLILRKHFRVMQQN